MMQYGSYKTSAIEVMEPGVGKDVEHKSNIDMLSLEEFSRFQVVKNFRARK